MWQVLQDRQRRSSRQRTVVVFEGNQSKSMATEQLEKFPQIKDLKLHVEKYCLTKTVNLEKQMLRYTLNLTELKLKLKKYKLLWRIRQSLLIYKGKIRYQTLTAMLFMPEENGTTFKIIEKKMWAKDLICSTTNFQA